MSVVDDYLAEVDEPQRAELERIRQIVKRAAPAAEEVISYGMPVFKYHGQYLIGFAAFKNHLSLFPASHPIEVLKDRLSDFKLSKGTIQFTLDHPIPESLIKQLVDIRLTDISKG